MSKGRKQTQRKHEPRPAKPSQARAEAPPSLSARFWDAEPIERLEIIRIVAPLAILGFLSFRIAHAFHWLGHAGFRVPRLPASSWQQPLYIPPLPDWAVIAVSVSLVTTLLMVALGLRTRVAALGCAALLVFVALSDRLAAFTVNKLAPVVLLAIALSPAGARYGVDAILASRKPNWRPVTHAEPAALRFLQGLFLVMYIGAGVCKLRGDWLANGSVLWTYLHDSYQTTVSYWIANALPVWAWTAFQVGTLVLEVGAPVLFLWRRTRPFAVLASLGMHLVIGLLFGPVLWFSLLMMGLAVGGWMPASWLPPWPQLRARLRNPRGWLGATNSQAQAS